jgi:hypothetical protein
MVEQIAWMAIAGAKRYWSVDREGATQLKIAAALPLYPANLPRQVLPFAARVGAVWSHLSMSVREGGDCCLRQMSQNRIHHRSGLKRLNIVSLSLTLGLSLGANNSELRALSQHGVEKSHARNAAHQIVR